MSARFFFKSRFIQYQISFKHKGGIARAQFHNGIYITCDEAIADSLKKDPNCKKHFEFVKVEEDLADRFVPTSTDISDIENAPAVGIDLSGIDKMTYTDLKQLWREVAPGTGIPSRSSNGIRKALLEKTTAMPEISTVEVAIPQDVEPATAEAAHLPPVGEPMPKKG